MAAGRGGGKGAEDAALWAAVTRDVKPLAGRKRLLAGSAEDKGAAGAPEPSPQPEPKRRAGGTLPPAPAGGPAPPQLSPGRSAGLDRRSAERLRRGKLPVEATLDLHGMTQEAAHAALTRFLSESQERGRRCVLLVTGKGRGGEDSRGVLRRQVPNWLNEPPNRERLLAFDHARARDGGTGALYLLLRRRREA